MSTPAGELPQLGLRSCVTGSCALWTSSSTSGAASLSEWLEGDATSWGCNKQQKISFTVCMTQAIQELFHSSFKLLHFRVLMNNFLPQKHNIHYIVVLSPSLVLSSEEKTTNTLFHVTMRYPFEKSHKSHQLLWTITELNCLSHTRDHQLCLEGNAWWQTRRYLLWCAATTLKELKEGLNQTNNVSWSVT